MTYPSRNWKATESTDLVGSKYKLTVTGETEVHSSNQKPKLAEAKPQGISRETLILDLKVESQGDVGADVLEWKAVEFVKEVSPREHDHVTITGETDEHTIKVEVILS